VGKAFPGREILPGLPVNKFEQFYNPGRGAATKELHAMLGAIVLQQMNDLTDEETIYHYAVNIQWHYALNITDGSDAYLSLKTLWNMRRILTEGDLSMPPCLKTSPIPSQRLFP
jgi:hypothetical protein